jgi:hypothetical protein
MRSPRRKIVLGALLFFPAACEQSTAPSSTVTPPSVDTARVPSPRFFYSTLASGLLISPVGLDFGNVQVGATAPTQSVTITNISANPVIMSGSGGAPPSGKFGGVQSCQGLTLAPDASCQMSFAFAPATTGPLTDASVGTWNGQSFNIALRGTGTAPRFRINPAGLDFGNVIVGTTAPTQSVNITNAGSAPVKMSGSGGAPPTGKFGGAQSCQGLTLAVGASCQMSFEFSPTVAGDLTDASIGAWNGQSFNIALHGVGVDPRFAISPSALEFGEVRVGSTSPSQSVSITNLNTVPVKMSGSGGAPPSGKFGGVQACQGLTLAPGASCAMTFAFSPTAPGELTDASIGTWNGQSYNVSLHGVGLSAVASPTKKLLISPTGIDFGDVTVGSTSPTKNVTITNVGTSTLLMSGSGGAPPTGKFGGSQNCQGASLAPGASCQMSFAFTPATAGDLIDASTGTWNGQAFNIALHGNGKKPVVLVTPSSIDFGDVQIGSTSATQQVKITNLSPVSIVMSGSGGAPPSGKFGGSQNCQGLTLASGASCQMSFAFSPSDAGPLVDHSTGTWNGQPFNIALTGNGAPPHFLITPFALDFGLVPLTVTGPAQDVFITNDGLDAVVMSGAGGAPPTGRFGGVQSCQGLTLVKGASCHMSFAFTPVNVGLLTDASIGSWNDQPFNIALQGSGFTDLPTVAMDLNPATISLSGTSATTAVLLSGSGFNATTVTLANVRMLVNGTTEVSPLSRSGVVISSVRDWNGDGLPDRIFSFQTSALKAAGLIAGAGADALILRDNISGSKWRAQDAAPPNIVP